MYRSIRNFNIPPRISREFDFKSSPGSREFDVLSLPCGGAFDKGGEFEAEVLKFCPFSRASCMHRRYLYAQKRQIYSFLRFRGKRAQFCVTLAQRNGHGKAMCFIGRSVLQNCVKLLNFHKVSKLFK